MNCFSNHIYMFPFSLKGCGEMNSLRESLKDVGWYHDGFEYTKGDYANNFYLQAYFYEFAIGALIDDGSKNSVIETFTKKIGENAEFTIFVSASKNREAKEYKLCLEKLTLNLYDCKVGILAFHLENRQYDKIDDILAINDFGRRIYPLYFNLNENKEVDLGEVKQNLLADKIRLDLDLGIDKFEEDFSRYRNKIEHPFSLPNHIIGILPDCMHNVHWLQDDRMYVISWYGNDEISSRCNLPFTKEEIESAYQHKDEIFDIYDLWYRFLFIYKGGKTGNSKTRYAHQLVNATYDRWAEDGCLYGVTRFSFVSLTNRPGFNKGRKYMKSMYYYMASLCLAQRTMILYFSNEITDITARLNQSGRKGADMFDEIKQLNLDFIRFMNNIYFREVTTQTQGIELYNMMQSQMEIETDVKELKLEIDQLYQYANMDGDQQRTKEAQMLNFMAAILLPITVITGIFGMNDFFEIYSNKGTYIELLIGLLICMTCLWYILKKRKS